MAAAIALGATSMSDIAVLAHLAPVLGAAPSGPTVRRALDLAGTPAMLDRIARARAKARAHVWTLIEGTPAGFPWLVIAGQDADGLGGDRHGRHLGHRALRQGRGGSDLEERLRLPSLGGVVFEYARVPGHAAAPRQRRLEHVHRSPGRAGRRDPAGARPVPAQDPGPRGRRRRQPRAHQAPAGHVLPAPESAVHLRVDDHRRRRGRHRAGAGGCVEAGHRPGRQPSRRTRTSRRSRT